MKNNYCSEHLEDLDLVHHAGYQKQKTIVISWQEGDPPGPNTHIRKNVGQPKELLLIKHPEYLGWIAMGLLTLTPNSD